MALQDFWFIALAVLFVGFFVLEGFDFGVGMLMKLFGRVAEGDREQHERAVLNTIGPVWDGNEVWLITAAVRCSRRSRGCTPRCSPACICRSWPSCSA